LDIKPHDIHAHPVSFRNPIRAHAEDKAGKLTRYYDGVQQITVRLRKPDHHSNHPTYEVELTADAEKHNDFVGTATGDDLYLAIDGAVQKVARQLTDFKEKLKINGHHPKG
ncbi:MAG: ribosome-associated translation inhibitor RaiA, partial [Planctomycetota bacterium]